MFRNGSEHDSVMGHRRRPTRRRVLRDAGLLIVSAGLPPASAIADRAAPAIPTEEPSTPFDRSVVTELARRLAASDFVEPHSGALPAELAGLTYTQYRDIAFKSSAAIWADSDLPFRLHLFHRGFIFDKRVDVAVVNEGKARLIAYSPDMFVFGERVSPVSAATDPGFSGFRILAPLNRPDKFDEIAVFQGASYFRSLGRDEVYGLSARGLALKTAAQDGEEFPAFRHFWVEKPGAADGTIVVHALLDSPSVAGAYRFSLRPGESTSMDVEAILFPRVVLAQVGLAPGTSMFYFGSNDRVDIDDYRPEVHDSDGLLIANGRGELLWRPLANPATLQISAFVDSAPRGFGLIQRNRDFDAYQDVEAAYERRPSLWIEPIGDWGSGSVTLVEIPTDSEIHDNIVAYWAPLEPIAAGGEYAFAYRLHWGGEPKPAGDVVRVSATRIGRATIGRPPQLRLFVIDYEADDPDLTAAIAAPRVTVSASAGKLGQAVVVPIPGNGGWRVTFELDPEDAESIELRASLELSHGRRAEVWVYRWTP